MRHARWSFGFIVAVLIATCAAAPALAQPVARDWSTLRAAPLPTWRVSVFRRDAPRLSGFLRSIDSTGLVLNDEADDRRVAVDDVLRIERANSRSRRIWTRGVPIGFLLGGLVMTAIDAGSGNPEPGEAFAMGSVLLGIPIGAGTAALLPVHPIYIAPRPR